MNSRKKRKLSLIMTAIMIFSCGMLPYNSVKAVSAIAESAITDIRLKNIFEDQIDKMISMSNELGRENKDLEIERVTEMSDFCGNTYTLVECSPVGYIIYHNESGVFVEYSPVVNSPFYGKEGDYKYVGPNEYYIVDKMSDCRYAFDDEPLNVAEIKKLVDNSNTVNNTLN